MSLETPNRIHASCVVLARNIFDPPNETLEFRNNTGFKSVAFLDPDDTPVGVVLELVSEVTNDEGSVYFGSDMNGLVQQESPGAFITPIHLQTGEPLIDDLEPNQVVVAGFFPKEDSFRFNVMVMSVLTEALPIEGEPLPPP